MNRIKLVILFGSQAAGTSGGTSDTDIAVLAERPLTLDERSALGDEYAERLAVPEEKIDLVDLAMATPILRYQVARTGKLLYGKEEDFIRFKVLAWKQYLNTGKFRRLRHDSMENRFNVKGSSS